MEATLRRKYWFVQGLTLGRVPLIFVVLVVCVAIGHPLPGAWFAIAFAAMLLSALTDLLDGHFARKFQVSSSLGSYADPMTDKVFYLTAFPLLVYLAGRAGEDMHARVLVVLAVVFLLRDQWVSFLRSVGALHGISGKANWSGKARTAVSFPTICVVFYYFEAPLNWPLRPPDYLVFALETFSVAINLVSIFVYTSQFWPALRIELSPKSKSA
jgi:CDP-diacylglycerol--glycerol-3-phosphate 3-phosphatidyltransferase